MQLAQPTCSIFSATSYRELLLIIIVARLVVARLVRSWITSYLTAGVMAVSTYTGADPGKYSPEKGLGMRLI